MAISDFLSVTTITRVEMMLKAATATDQQQQQADHGLFHADGLVQVAVGAGPVAGVEVLLAQQVASSQATCGAWNRSCNFRRMPCTSPGFRRSRRPASCTWAITTWPSISPAPT